MNTFGNIFRLTTFGESHGPVTGGVIDGMPAGIRIDMNALETMMARRRPGSSANVSARREADRPEFLSGMLDGVTTGTPIAFTIANTDARSADYDALANTYRPCHADYTYQMKYGIRDYRGGGRASARETAARVVSGALAKQVLTGYGISVDAYILQIGRVAEKSAEVTADMAAEMELARAEGDTLGGIVGCTITGCPAGLGEPMYAKLQAMLAGAMMSINAAKGFDYGSGFAGASLRGSELIDNFIPATNGTITTQTNHSGGIQGGISNGQPIYFRVVFKPVATMMRPMQTVDTDGRPVTLQPRGRHDVCVVPRAVAGVEAMAAMTILDAIMMDQSHGSTRFV